MSVPCTILVLRGRASFGQHQESRPLGRSNIGIPRFTDLLTLVTRMLGVKSDKSDWLRIRKDYSAHAPKIGPFQRLRFLVLTKRSVAFGDENALVHTLVLKLRKSRNIRICIGKGTIFLSLKEIRTGSNMNKSKPTWLQVCVSLVPVRFLGRIMVI